MRLYARTSRNTGVSMGPLTVVLIGFGLLCLLTWLGLVLAALFAVCLVFVYAKEKVNDHRNR